MTVYTLNLRVFWSLVACLLATLLLLYISSPPDGTESGPDGCREQSLWLAWLTKLLLALVIFALLLGYCSSRGRSSGRRSHEAPVRALSSKRELLEDFYERHVRLSPHVLGHSKAHVAKLVGELVKAGRPEVPPESSLAFRGDFVQIGSSYEEHKVGRPDCFDILVPLRLPRGFRLEPRSGCNPELEDPSLCVLETPRRSDWTRRHKAFTEAFLSLDATGTTYRLSPEAVLRWFYAAATRCLSAVRYPFEQRCSLGLSFSEDRVLLRLTPRADYVCCHISMVVRLVPALPLGDGAYWVAAGQRLSQGGGALWAAYLPRQEQKLLGWLKGRLPPGSCHLKCLQMAKAVRDLSGLALGSQGAIEWRAVLSSYSLKTAWLRLLLATPPEAWEERHLLERLEELLRSVRDGLQRRNLGHLFLGGDTGLLPDFLAVPKPIKSSTPSNLWAGFSPAALDLVAARLAYSWTHLHRLIRLGRPQRASQGGGVPCKHMDAE
ncbi:inositol 1,4,5-trisphosphate receptor-interacting protein-like 2 [Scleropages formosus]|uniref:inositol 1,4,5-trisphosphate receptor-interacting protein-like 2 n=1 Tax=Scleropages formosus TaxID=113540 RepID=UPI000878E2A0|nr:inositol 1,4,5-trisphosphate receptor-interacting protein-like 2 [Scleropages formosus]